MLLVRGSTVLLMCCSSQVTGTFAASIICLTALEISGPTPAFAKAPTLSLAAGDPTCAGLLRALPSPGNSVAENAPALLARPATCCNPQPGREACSTALCSSDDALLNMAAAYAQVARSLLKISNPQPTPLTDKGTRLNMDTARTTYLAAT
ncbi:hypothetical protein HaLaN_02762 [Haematococcus lacustris]|uniref:Uncharacterized protein n=1 Tax=Haematococcus lacustris TaxID=44745 RepID=A0A699YCF8_HAELA|nr:hypothetical protein HaLaN_02762 [Haematococcus lacustris]